MSFAAPFLSNKVWENLYSLALYLNFNASIIRKVVLTIQYKIHAFTTGNIGYDLSIDILLILSKLSILCKLFQMYEKSKYSYFEVIGNLLHTKNNAEGYSVVFHFNFYLAVYLCKLLRFHAKKG